MGKASRLRALEEEFEILAAIVDGGEVQAREATVAVLGLLIDFLVGKDAFTYGAMIEYLASCAEPDREADDHVGRLIHDLKAVVEFHRDADAGVAKEHVPVDQALLPDEITRIRDITKASVALDRTSVDPATKRKVKRKPPSIQ